MLEQALRPGVAGGKDGSFRASFEDKPLLSDLVFLRAWVRVDLPRFYNPVTNLLAPPPLAPARGLKPGRGHPANEDDVLGTGNFSVEGMTIGSKALEHAGMCCNPSILSSGGCLSR